MFHGWPSLQVILPSGMPSLLCPRTFPEAVERFHDEKEENTICGCSNHYVSLLHLS